MGCLLGSSLMATSSKRTYAIYRDSQVCCCQSLCPCGRPLLTYASTGDRHSKAGLAQSLVTVTAPFPGSWYTQGFVCVFWTPLAGMRFDFKHECTAPTILLGLLLFPWAWGIFFSWIPTFSCLWLFSSYLWFWCSHRRWAHVLLFHHLAWLV